MLPNFIGIGAQRAATTWVHQCLREHPEVFVPEQKELHYFNEHWDKGLDWYGSHFRPQAGQRAIGEISPNYLESEKAIRRMAQTIPEARLFVILREPVERAVSAYTIFRSLYGQKSFAEACTAGSNLMTIGFYAQHLERVFSYYPRERVKVFLYDDVQASPRQVLAELFSFLGVDSTFVPASVRAVYNSSRTSSVQTTLSSWGLSLPMDWLKGSFLGRWSRRWVLKVMPKSGDPIQPETLESLRQTYREDILRLQQLIGRDLSHWLREKVAS